MIRFAHAVYCDDVRQEVGNKISLIGVYHGKLFLPQFPVVLPKLGIALWVRTPATKPFRKLGFRVLIGDNQLVNVPVDQSIVDSYLSMEPTTDPEKISMFHTSLIMSPVPLDGPTTIRVRVDTEDEELKAGALEIELAAPSEPPKR